jgi:hypothetical protein
MKRPLAIALTVLALTGLAFLTGCGDDSDGTTQSQTVEQPQTTGTLSEEEKARKIGNLVEEFQRQEAEKTQRNIERHQSGQRTCPEGQGYNAQLDICL